MWVCQLLPPRFLGLPTVFEHKSDSSKNNSFHGISYKKNGRTKSSLVSWKAGGHFWKKHSWLTCPYMVICCFLRTKGADWFAKVRERRPTLLSPLLSLVESFTTRDQMPSPLRCFSSWASHRWAGGSANIRGSGRQSGEMRPNAPFSYPLAFTFWAVLRCCVFFFTPQIGRVGSRVCCVTDTVLVQKLLHRISFHVLKSRPQNLTRTLQGQHISRIQW